MQCLITHLFGPPLCIAAVLPPKKRQEDEYEYDYEHDQRNDCLGKIDARHVSAPFTQGMINLPISCPNDPISDYSAE